MEESLLSGRFSPCENLNTRSTQLSFTLLILRDGRLLGDAKANRRAGSREWKQRRTGAQSARSQNPRGGRNDRDRGKRTNRDRKAATKAASAMVHASKGPEPGGSRQHHGDTSRHSLHTAKWTHFLLLTANAHVKTASMIRTIVPPVERLR